MRIGLCIFLLVIQATAFPRFFPFTNLHLHQPRLWNISTALHPECMRLCSVTMEDEQMCKYTCGLLTEVSSLKQLAESDWSDVDLSPFDFMNSDQTSPFTSTHTCTHHPSNTLFTRHKRSVLKTLGKGAKGAAKLGKKVWPKITKFVNELWSMLKTFAVFEYIEQFVPSFDEMAEGMCVIARIQSPL